MEFPLPREQPTANPRTTFSSIPHYVPQRIIRGTKSRSNEFEKEQTARRREFEAKIANLKLEFPEYGSMLTHPAFRDGLALDTKTSANASTLALYGSEKGNTGHDVHETMEDDTKHHVQTIHLSAQIVNLTINADQYISNISEQPAHTPTSLSCPLSRQSQPRSPTNSNGPIPSSVYESGEDVRRRSRSLDAVTLADTDDQQENCGTESSQAKILVSDILTSRDVGLKVVR